MDGVRPAMHDTLLLVARLHVAHVVALLLHQVLSVHIKLLVMFANVHELLLLIFNFFLLLHLLERDLVVVEPAQLILLLLKKQLGVHVFGAFLLAVIQGKQVPH